MGDMDLSEVGHNASVTGSPTLPPPPWETEVILPENQSSWTRRDFIKGVIASGATVSGLSYFGAGCTSSLPAQTSVGVERLISLNVNGQTRRVDVLPSETLAMTLRYKLGLTGTKLGCDRAECGYCDPDHQEARGRRERGDVRIADTAARCAGQQADPGCDQ